MSSFDSDNGQKEDLLKHKPIVVSYHCPNIRLMQNQTIA